MRRVRALTAALLTCFALPAAAGAAPPWSPTQPLSASGQDADEVAVAMNGAGDAIVVWDRSNGLHDIVQASSRVAGGSFGPPADLSAVGQDAFFPDVAIAPSGEAVASWIRFDGTLTNVLQASIRPAGGAFPTGGDTLSLAGANANAGRVAIAPSGEAVLVWLRGGAVQAAIRAPGGAFRFAGDLSPTVPPAGDPQVAIAPSGLAIAVWTRFIGGRQRVQASVRPPGGSFAPPVELSADGQDAFSPQVALEPDGDATIVWTRADALGGAQIQAVERPAGGGFGPVDDVTEAGLGAFGPQLAVAADGGAAVVWTLDVGTRDVIQAATRAPGGSFGPPTPLSNPAQNAFSPALAIGPAGQAVAAWSQSVGMSIFVEAAVRPSGGQFGPPVQVSAPGLTATDVQVAVDDEGSALAAFLQFDGSSLIATASHLDAAGPRLTGLTVPLRGTVGLPVPVSVSAFDVWSPFSVAWSFGDGGSATGPSASHVYARAGTYPVTVTATDATGRATSATRQLVVTSGAPPTTPTPVVGRLRVAPAAFRAAGGGPSVVPPPATRRGARRRARARTGARVTFHANVAATFAFRVERQAKGRRVGGRCVRATSRNRRARVCTRGVAVRGGFAYRAIAGANAFTFSGRVNGRKLAPGRYRLLATPSAAGGRGDTASFRILRPAPARRRARR